MEFIHFEASDGNENDVDFNVENKVGDDLMSFIDNSARNENLCNYLNLLLHVLLKMH